MYVHIVVSIVVTLESFTLPLAPFRPFRGEGVGG